MTDGAAFNEGHTDASGNLRTYTFFFLKVSGEPACNGIATCKCNGPP